MRWAEIQSCSSDTPGSAQTSTLLESRERLMSRAHSALRVGPESLEAARVAGVNIVPSCDDDGWLDPPPARMNDATLVYLFKDGEALWRAYEAIESANRRVWLEVYIFHADSTGRAFANLLTKRARQGLDVRVICDAFGSLGSDQRMFDAMRRAGVRLLRFHPLRVTTPKRVFHRDHRKLLVVDDQTALLGGQNLGDEYGSSWIAGVTGRETWRDTAIGVHGPSAQLLAEAFARVWNYVEQGGSLEQTEFFQSMASWRDELLPGRSDRPQAQPVRHTVARKPRDAEILPLDLPETSIAVLASSPSRRSRLLPALRTLLRNARESIEMTMAYFAPPDELMEQFCRSAEAGVRVRMMLPGRSDVHLLVVAARAFYERLLAANVEVYERQHAVLHAKTLCIDGRISIVGSTNLDYRSIQHNCELSAVINSTEFGAQMHALFEHDVRFAHRIVPDQWRHRPLRDRVMQRAVLCVRPFL